MIKYLINNALLCTNCIDNKGNTILMLTLKFCDDDISILLLEKYSSKTLLLNNVNNSGESVLHIAISESCRDIILKIIEYEEIRVDLLDKDNNLTPISLACIHGLVDIVLKMINKYTATQLALNSVDKNNNTAIIYAIDNKMESVVLQMMEKYSAEELMTPSNIIECRR